MRVCCDICFGFLLFGGGMCTGVFEGGFCGDLGRKVVLDLGSDLVLEGFSIYICVVSYVWSCLLNGVYFDWGCACEDGY